MILNPFGLVVMTEWLRSQQLREEIILDECVVMPDHFHGIVWIEPERYLVGADGRPPLPDDNRPPLPDNDRMRSWSRSLSSLISGFKSSTTKQINILRQTRGAPLWQRGYYDHIVRDEYDLFRIRNYIRHNPLSVHMDGETHMGRGTPPVRPFRLPLS
jgi:REP element-mobilizing transposase RayT